METTDDERAAPAASHADRAWRSVATTATFGGVGLLFFVGFTWNYLRELDELSTPGPPTLVFLFGAVLAVGLAAWGYRLARSDFDPADRWAVALWTFAGTAALTAVVGFTLWIRIAEGRTVEEPQLTVMVGAASGGHLGALAGHYYAAARQRAAETDRAREALSFLNRTIRHEVLNGMTVIEGNASRLRDAEDPHEPLQAIEAESRDIGERMRDVQEIVDVLAGETAIETVDLSEMTASRVAFAREAHPNATVEATIEDDVTVRGVEPLEHAIDNLLGNAVEHGARTGRTDGDGPTVAVRVGRDGDEGLITVTDDGPGIPAEELASLFEPEEGGTHGFGLYLVRTLVEQCDGAVTARNDPDRGATFEIRLPLA